MTQYNKLVRDNIPAICERNGAKATTRVLRDKREYIAALYAKLEEEMLEVKAAKPEDILGELADVQEVILAIGKVHDYTPEHIEAKRAQKLAERGGFDKRIFLVSTEAA